MNAKSLLIAVICISAVLASGPVFIMTSSSSGEKEYFNKAMQGEEVAAFLPTTKKTVFIHYNDDEKAGIKTLEEYIGQFKAGSVFTHVNGTIENQEWKEVHNLEELKKIEIRNKNVVLQYVQEFEEPAKVAVAKDKGVSMTPAILFALLTIFTLAYSFYAAVMCVDAVQTPTRYATEGLAVGKEF